MNRLIIIGNGFDLAHGYKTSYQDFLFHLLFKELLIFRDELKNKTHNPKQAKDYFYFQAQKDSFYYLGISKSITDFEMKLEKGRCNKFGELKNFLSLNKGYFVLNITSNLILRLYTDLTIKNWVDVEEAYYTLLKSFENKKTGLTFREGDLRQIDLLNTDLSFLANELEKYLKLATANPSFIEGMSEVFENDGYIETNILNFNYTKSFEQYFSEDHDYFEINIHGQLNSKSNPIIFGVGDENHSLYSKIVESNVDEMLINVKSLKYLETHNYARLKFKLQRGEFDVYVIGHSCGISDRTLLKEVFTSENCKKINIYHYEGINSYRKSIYGASRYFDNNFDMRQKIEPFSEYLNVPQKQN